MTEPNADFEAKVRRTYANRSVPVAGGKGSPAALLAIGVVGTLLLGACAALLGGGLLYLPAAIPLVTVLAVLGARWWSARSAS